MKGTVFIPLKHGIMKLDIEDYVKIKSVGRNLYSVRNHRKTCSTGNFYACYRGQKRAVFLHRFIMEPENGMVIDHINGNGLDNRRINLRVCTQAQNTANQKGVRKDAKYSKYKGVSMDRGRWWYAQITFNRKNIRQYGFKNEIEAALWYNKKAKELFGEFACLNEINAPSNN